MQEQEIIQFFIEILNIIGRKRSIYTIIIVSFIILLPKLLNWGFQSYKAKKNAEVERLNYLNSKEERKEYFGRIDLLFENNAKTLEAIYIIIEKLNISISVSKFQMLKDSFLGLNRTFIDSFKFRLLTYFENITLDTYTNVKLELQNYYIEKVINRLLPFILKDQEFIHLVKKESIQIISKFIDKVKKISETEDVKTFLDSEKGLSLLNHELSELLDQVYSELTAKETSYDYIRKGGSV